MDLIQASILGLVQGLTEYLPVSSSAHLVLVPKWLGWHFEPKHAFVFDVLVQMGTLIGVIAYFFKDLWAVKIGFQYLFTEYDTNTNVQQFPGPNDRFRNKSSMFSVGLTRQFK